MFLPILLTSEPGQRGLHETQYDKLNFFNGKGLRSIAQRSTAIQTILMIRVRITVELFLI